MPSRARRRVVRLTLLLSAIAPAAIGLSQSPILSGYLFDADALESVIESESSKAAEPGATEETEPAVAQPAPTGKPTEPEVRRLTFGVFRPRMVLTPSEPPAPEPAVEPRPVLEAEPDWSAPPALADEPPVEEQPQGAESTLSDPSEPTTQDAAPIAPEIEPAPQPTPEPVPVEPADGPVVLRDTQGRIEASGRYDQDQPQGSWTRHYLSDASPVVREVVGAGFETPLRAELTLAAGVPEGPCTISDAQGRLVSRLELRAGRLHGRCVWHLPDGTLLRDAHYRDGRLHGPQQNRAAQAATNWVEGRRLDPYQPAVPAGQPTVSGWVLAAEPVAEHSFDWWTGAWLARVVDQPTTPLRHGEWIWRHADGRRQGLGTFEFGREEGYWIVWHPSGGKRTEGQYRHGTPVGHWQRWDDHGQLIAQQTFPTQAGADLPSVASGGGAAGLILRR